MKPELLHALRPRLDRDFSFKESQNGKWLQEGVCPACGKKTLYAPADGP